MANIRVLLKKSGVLGKLPTEAEYGELFINYHSGDPMLCFKDNAGQIVQIKPARSIDGGGGETPPTTGNEDGDIIWNGSQILVWDTDTWIPVGPSDLAYIQKTDKGEVTSTAGSGFEIPAVNNLQAGLMLPGDKSNLDSLVAGGASLWEIDGANLKPKDGTKDININSGKVELKASTGNVLAAGDGQFDGKVTAGSTVEGTGGVFNNSQAKVLLSSGNGAFYGYDSDDLANPTSVINKDGSSELKNVTCSYQTNGNTLVDGDGVQITASNEVAAVLSPDGLNLGGAIPVSPNIYLDASDGHAVFASYIQSGASATGGTGTGAYLLAQGVVGATRVNDNDILWSGYKSGFPAPTSSIFADGGGFYRNSVVVGSNPSSSQAGGAVFIQSDLNQEPGVYIYNKNGSSSQLAFQIRAGGGDGTTKVDRFNVYTDGSLQTGPEIKLQIAGVSYYNKLKNNGDGLLLDVDPGAGGGAGADLRVQIKNEEKLRVNKNGELILGIQSPYSVNSPAIKLNGDNGSIQSGYIATETTNGSVNLNVENGALLVSPDGLFANATAIIGHDGNATFAGSVLSGDGAGNYINVHGPQGVLTVISDTVSSNVIQYGRNGATPLFAIGSDGGGVFSSTVKGEGESAYVTVNRTGAQSATAALYLGFYNGDQKFKVAIDGSATFTGQINGTTVGTSDAQFKENITPAKPQLADVVTLGGMLKNFDWNESAPVSEEIRSQRQLGLIAQEVETICPTLVKDIKATKTMEITPAVVGPKGKVITEAVTEEVDDSYKGLSQEALIMKLIGAVAELTAEVQELKKAS